MTLLLLALLAHDPITTKITWSVEISRLVNRHCIGCHATGSSVDLSNYQAARPWAKAIRNQVLDRHMPPWGAVKGFGDFRNDPSLTPLEMEMINQWVEGGSPEGDAAFLSNAATTNIAKAQTFRWMPLGAIIVHNLAITAIRPAGPTEVSAYLPDGTVQHLIWIRERQPNYKRIYIYREPIALPAGTKIRIVGASAEIS